MKIRRAAEQDLADLHRLLLQVNLVHHRGRPDLFRAGGAKYTDRQLLRSVKEAAPGMELKTVLPDGTVISKVVAVNEKETEI